MLLADADDADADDADADDAADAAGVAGAAETAGAADDSPLPVARTVVGELARSWFGSRS